MEEYLDVLDENGNQTGQALPRSVVHTEGQWHKTAHIWIANDKDEILLQRRSYDKDDNPGMLDISVAGHLAAGDDSLHGAVRELSEEIGLNIELDELELIGTVKRSSESKYVNSNEFQDVYLVKTDKTIDDFTIDKNEVDEIFYVPFSKFKQMVVDHDQDLLRHDKEYELLLKRLKI